MINITIDGTNIEVSEGTTVLQAARQLAIAIPTLCHNEHLLPYGACRLCTVEIGRQGRYRLQASCTYPVEDGLEVKTNTERVVRGRKIMAELLLARCSGNPAVRKLAADLGVQSSRFSGKSETCVLCGQCVRICSEVVGASAIGFAGRGITRKVQTPFDKPSAQCLACGACTFICPTGHIQMESLTRRHWQKTLQPAARQCRYARIGFFADKICPNDFRCQTCEVDQRMEDLLKSHPALLARRAAGTGSVRVGEFALLPALHYSRGHIWAAFLDGNVKLGIDDFARQVLHSIDAVRAPKAGTRIGERSVLWELEAGGKRLSMLSPLAGRIISTNPHLQVDPPLVSREPFGRGWIALIGPESREESEACRRNLMTGKAARRWLAGEAARIHAWVDPISGRAAATQDRLASDLPAQLDDRQWRAFITDFFSQV